MVINIMKTIKELEAETYTTQKLMRKFTLKKIKWNGK